MVLALRRWFGRRRSEAVRLRLFDRRPRIRSGPLPYLTAHEQAVYEQACRNVERLIPTTGERGR